MKTLEQIKNEFSKEKGFKDFNNLIFESDIYQKNNHINELLILVQKECLKNASENAEADMFYDSPIVVKESITNENNIIK